MRHRILRVVIRDDAPMALANDCPTYRSVAIELTDEQREVIKLRQTGSVGGSPIDECVSKVFFDE